jgi:hypothetical protein
MRQLYPGRPVAPERSPQAEDHPTRLEEHDLVVGLLRAAPPQRLIKCSSADEVGDSKSHKADPLLHA